MIFDTETTGGDDPKMIEAAGIVLSPGDIDLRPVDHFEFRYTPASRPRSAHWPPTISSTANW